MSVEPTKDDVWFVDEFSSDGRIDIPSIEKLVPEGRARLLELREKAVKRRRELEDDKRERAIEFGRGRPSPRKILQALYRATWWYGAFTQQLQTAIGQATRQEKQALHEQLKKVDTEQKLRDLAKANALVAKHEPDSARLNRAFVTVVRASTSEAHFAKWMELAGVIAEASEERT